MGSECLALLATLVVGIYCNSGAAAGSNAQTARQGFFGRSQVPNRPPSGSGFTAFRPPFFQPFGPQRRQQNRAPRTQSLASLVTLLYVFQKILDNNNDNNDDTPPTDAPAPTVECNWGSWGSCSTLLQTCGTRRRSRTCNGVAEVETESCTFTTQTRTLDDGDWYLADNCYEYFVSAATVADRATASTECGTLGGILASKGMRDQALRTDILDQFTPAGTEVYIGVKDDVTEGEFVWDDGDQSFPNFFSPDGNNGGTRDCFTVEFGDTFSLRARNCNNDRRFLCERPSSQ